MKDMYANFGWLLPSDPRTGGLEEGYADRKKLEELQAAKARLTHVSGFNQAERERSRAVRDRARLEHNRRAFDINYAPRPVVHRPPQYTFPAVNPGFRFLRPRLIIRHPYFLHEPGYVHHHHHGHHHGHRSRSRSYSHSSSYSRSYTRRPRSKSKSKRSKRSKRKSSSKK